MTPVGFVFLNLIFGVIIPTPTQGKMKMTFREAMSMSSIDLEKRQDDDRTVGETAAFLTFRECLEKLSIPTGGSCDESYGLTILEEITKKYKATEDIPIAAWVRYAGLTCGPRAKYRDCIRDTHKCACGSPDVVLSVNNVVHCAFAPESGVTYQAEFNVYQSKIPRNPDGPTGSGRGRGVSASKSGWCLTVMAVIVISGRLLFSP